MGQISLHLPAPLHFDIQRNEGRATHLAPASLRPSYKGIAELPHFKREVPESLQNLPCLPTFICASTQKPIAIARVFATIALENTFASCNPPPNQKKRALTPQ
eukprot:RCo052328